MTTSFPHITTVVLHRDGRLRFTSDKISLIDAERWAAEGFEVFRLAATPKGWVMNHVETGIAVSKSEAEGVRFVNSSGRPIVDTDRPSLPASPQLEVLPPGE